MSRFPISGFFRPCLFVAGLSFYCSSFASTANAEPYAEADLGWVQQSGLPLQQIPGYNTQSNLGARLAVGDRFSLTSKFSLGPELAYAYYGFTSFSGDPTGFNAYSNVLELLGVGTYAVTPLFSVFSKFGLGYQYLSGENVQTSNGYYQLQDRGLGPVIAFGSSYQFSMHIEGVLTYSHFFGDSLQDPGSTGVPSLNSVMLGVKYIF